MNNHEDLILKEKGTKVFARQECVRSYMGEKSSKEKKEPYNKVSVLSPNKSFKQNNNKESKSKLVLAAKEQERRNEKKELQEIKLSEIMKEPVKTKLTTEQLRNTYTQKTDNWQTIEQQSIITKQKNELTTKQQSQRTALISGLVVSLIIIGGLLAKINKKSQKK